MSAGGKHVKANGMPCVMLVDDDEHILRTLGDFLRMNDLDVVTASDGDEALRRLLVRKPDAIVLGISMPGMGGMALLRRLRDDEATQAIPVLVFTGRVGMADFLENLDVAGVITKPCDESALLRKIRAAVGIPAPRSASARLPRTGLKVLVVEDDDNVLREIVHVFGKAGHSVKVVHGAPDAVMHIERHRPDAVVMKNVLPGMTGSCAAGLIGELRPAADLPIILYDGTLNRWQAEQAQAKRPAGATAFVASNDAQHLLGAVVGACARIA